MIIVVGGSGVRDGKLRSTRVVHIATDDLNELHLDVISMSWPCEYKFLSQSITVSIWGHLINSLSPNSVLIRTPQAVSVLILFGKTFLFSLKQRCEWKNRHTFEACKIGAENRSHNGGFVSSDN